MNIQSPTAVLLPAIGRPSIRVPLFSHAVPAGFPSPADDYVEGRLSLDEHLIANKDATFFVRARGKSMEGAGIQDGNILVVDKSITPKSGSIVVAFVDGEYTVKTFIKRAGKIVLRPENPSFSEIEFKDGQELQVWGVVVGTVKKYV
ncbi:MAG: translesion error-prone DNA polymerase V autoproteolytic subunit [Sideroxydans sp.]